MQMPPAARRSQTANLMVGVGQTPTSMTRQPVARRPANTASRIASREMRVSFPTTTVDPGGSQVPNACANRVMTSGVRDFPAIPRMPEMLIMRVLSGVVINPPVLFCCLAEGRGKQEEVSEADLSVLIQVELHADADRGLAEGRGEQEEVVETDLPIPAEVG